MTFEMDYLHNKSLHWILTQLRSIKTSELRRWVWRMR